MPTTFFCVDRNSYGTAPLFFAYKRANFSGIGGVRVGGTGRVASPRRPAFYGEVISLRRPMLTVRSEIGPRAQFFSHPKNFSIRLNSGRFSAFSCLAFFAGLFETLAR